MELIKLLGVLIVIVGFALKLDSILIIFLALITTGIVGGLGVGGLLETIGTNFVANRAVYEVSPFIRQSACDDTGRNGYDVLQREPQSGIFQRRIKRRKRLFVLKY